MRKIMGAAVVVAALVLGACGGDEDAADAGGAETTTTSVAASSSDSTAGQVAPTEQAEASGSVRMTTDGQQYSLDVKSCSASPNLFIASDVAGQYNFYLNMSPVTAPGTYTPVENQDSFNFGLESDSSTIYSWIADSDGSEGTVTLNEDGKTGTFTFNSDFLGQLTGDFTCI